MTIVQRQVRIRLAAWAGPATFFASAVSAMSGSARVHPAQARRARRRSNQLSAPHLGGDVAVGDGVTDGRPRRSEPHAQTEPGEPRDAGPFAGTGRAPARRRAAPTARRAAGPRDARPASRPRRSISATACRTFFPARRAGTGGNAATRPSANARHQRDAPGTRSQRGRARRADGRAQLHQRLVPVAGPARRDQRGGQRPQHPRAPRLAHRGPQCAQPRQHARHVPVQHGQRAIEGDGEHRCRRW